MADALGLYTSIPLYIRNLDFDWSYDYIDRNIPSYHDVNPDECYNPEVIIYNSVLGGVTSTLAAGTCERSM